jgi:hypothetical protein
MNGHNGGLRIGAWIGTFWRRLQYQATGDDTIVQATNRVVQIAGPVISQAKCYRQVLADPIAGSMRYFQSLLGTIPEPNVLDRRRYYDDPTVKALFASPDELDEVLRYKHGEQQAAPARAHRRGVGDDDHAATSVRRCS